MPTLECLPRLDSWRIDVDDADEVMLVGQADGEPVAGRVSNLDPDRGLAALKDGRRFVLGDPDPALGRADPFSLPAGAERRRLERLRTALQRIGVGDLPTEPELANAPQLDSWVVAIRGFAPVLVGKVHGHPRIVDGHAMASSPLVWISDDRRIARTVSRWYRLGRPLLRAPTHEPLGETSC